MALTWQDISSGQTDADSICDATLLDEVRQNLDALRARVRDTPTDTNWVTQSHVKVAYEDPVLEVGPANSSTVDGNGAFVDGQEYGFYPELRLQGAGTMGSLTAARFYLDSFGGVSLTTDWKAVIAALIQETAGTDLYIKARRRYISSTRDEGTLWIKHNKKTGLPEMSAFTPETYGSEPPIMIRPDERSTYELKAIELNHSPKLIEHLKQYKGTTINRAMTEIDFLDMFRLALITGVIELIDNTKPRMSAKAMPALHVPGLIVAKYVFHKSKADEGLATLEG